MEGIYGSITATGMHKVLECMKHNCGLGKSSTLIDIGAGLGRWGVLFCTQHGPFLQLVSCAVCVPAEPWHSAKCFDAKLRPPCPAVADVMHTHGLTRGLHPCTPPPRRFRPDPPARLALLLLCAGLCCMP